MARKRLLVGAGIVGVTGALSFAVPAAAHYTCAYHHSDHACLMTVPATNGAADGCAVNLSSMPITSYRVCEEEVSCSAWRHNT